MDQNQNNDLFDNNPPQQPNNDPNIAGGARVYPSGPAANEPVYTPPPGAQVYTQPPKKNNTIWIVLVVVVLLLCCCCLIGVGAWLWNNGDNLLNELDLSMRPLLTLLV
jgi:hypothetical protein